MVVSDWLEQIGERIRLEITRFFPSYAVVSSTNVLLLDASFHRGTWRQSSPFSTGYRGPWTSPPFSAAAPSSSPLRRLGARRKWRPFVVMLLT